MRPVSTLFPAKPSWLGSAQPCTSYWPGSNDLGSSFNINMRGAQEAAGPVGVAREGPWVGPGDLWPVLSCSAPRGRALPRAQSSWWQSWVGAGTAPLLRCLCGMGVGGSVPGRAAGLLFPLLRGCVTSGKSLPICQQNEQVALSQGPLGSGPGGAELVSGGGVLACLGEPAAQPRCTGSGEGGRSVRPQRGAGTGPRRFHVETARKQPSVV